MLVKLTMADTRKPVAASSLCIYSIPANITYTFIYSVHAYLKSTLNDGKVINIGVEIEGVRVDIPIIALIFTYL